MSKLTKTKSSDQTNEQLKQTKNMQKTNKNKESKNIRKLKKENNFFATYISRHFILNQVVLSLTAIVCAFGALVFTLLTQNYDPAQALSLPSYNVTIDDITQNGLDYEVKFTTDGFENSLTGEYLRFYFGSENENTTNKVYYGASPYIINLSDVPTSETELCVVAVNQGGNFVSQYENNCFAIPQRGQVTASITNVSVSGGNFLIDFTTNNYTQGNPDFSTLFYYNTQTNFTGGMDYAYEGQSPYTISTSSVPNGASQICIITGDTIVYGPYNNSGNCYALPLIQTPKVATITSAETENDDIIVTFTVSGFVNGENGYTTRFYYEDANPMVDYFSYSQGSPFVITNAFPTPSGPICVAVFDGTQVLPNSGNCDEFIEPDCCGQEEPSNSEITNITRNGDTFTITFTKNLTGDNKTLQFLFKNTESNTLQIMNYSGASPFVVIAPSGTVQVCSQVIAESQLIPNSGNCFSAPLIQPSTTGTTTTGTTTGTTTSSTTTGTTTGSTTSSTTTGTTTSSTAPFQINSSTKRLTSPLTSSKTSYTKGEPIKLDVKGIKKSDNTPASGLNCNFSITFTPVSTGRSTTIQIPKLTDSNGDCSVSIDSNGKISSLQSLFSIDADAQTTVQPGSTTTLLSSDGTGSATVSVTGSDNQTYFTNAINFSVGNVNTGNLPVTGGQNLATSITLISIILTGLVAYFGTRKSKQYVEK